MNTALITGANKGIGFALAKDLGTRGYHILVGARDAKRGDDAVKELRCLGITADLVLIELTDLANVRQAADAVQRDFPEVNLLVNNAATPGYPMRAPAWGFDAEEIERIWRTNFLGHFELIKQLMPTLAANHGKILNVSIPIEPSAVFNCFAYQTSKAPLNVMTKSLGLAFADQGVPIEILAVTPGGTSTDLNGRIAGPGVKTPEQAATAIVKFLFDGQDHNGQVINFDGKVYDYQNTAVAKESNWTRPA